jgi:hypothetical protein
MYLCILLYLQRLIAFAVCSSVAAVFLPSTLHCVASSTKLILCFSSHIYCAVLYRTVLYSSHCAQGDPPRLVTSRIALGVPALMVLNPPTKGIVPAAPSLSHAIPGLINS